jgi:GTPase SAR1 family protein
MGAIVVYDVTDENSFDSASHWIEEFRTKARQGAPIILAANK